MTVTEQIGRILDFVNDSVSIGTLDAAHPPPGDQNLQAFISMLAEVRALIGVEPYSEVSKQLTSVLGKCDGQSPPPDFVEGEALPELAELIQALIDVLSSEESFDSEGSKWGALRKMGRL